MKLQEFSLFFWFKTGNNSSEKKRRKKNSACDCCYIQNFWEEGAKESDRNQKRVKRMYQNIV